MKRDPIEAAANEKLRSIKVKTIKPLVLWTRCCKCGNEFKREEMYQCSFEDFFLAQTHYVCGCGHCFESCDEFVDYLRENHILYSAEELRDPVSHIKNLI